MEPLDEHAARWVGNVTGQMIDRALQLAGGMSSIVHRCDLSDGSTVVVKHVRDETWLAREPDLISREAQALDLIGASDCRHRGTSRATLGVASS